MIPTQHAVRNNHAPRNTAAPAAQSGDDSSFTPLPRGTPVRPELPGRQDHRPAPRSRAPMLAYAFRLPWPVAVTAQAWDDVVGPPQAGSALAQQLTLGVLAAGDRDGFHRSTRAKNTDHGHS